MTDPKAELIQMRRKAQHLRKNLTKEECHLWYDFLKTYPVQFRRQFPIDCYFVDFYCEKAKLVIELDGSQHYDPSTQAYDSRRTSVLERKGLLVLRFPNSDITGQFDRVCQQIHTAVEARIQG